MRNVIVMNRISVDGYFATNNEATGGMDWFVQDPKVDQTAHELVHSDTLLLGEKTFDLFERSWVPMLKDPHTPPPLKAVAQELTDMRKIAFTKSDKSSEWENTEFHKSGLTKLLSDLKEQDGTDILILGSGTIVQQLAKEDLIDKYLFILSPVIAGGGKPLFKDVEQHSLKLINTQAFDSGNVLLYYEVIK